MMSEAWEDALDEQIDGWDLATIMQVTPEEWFKYGFEMGKKSMMGIKGGGDE